MGRRGQENARLVSMVGVGRAAARSVAATVLLLGALFLTHGLRCVAAEGHDSTGMSHPATASSPANASMHPIGAEVGLLTPLAVPLIANLVDPTGADGPLSHPGVLCVAVLLVGAACWLQLAKRRPSRRDLPHAPVRRPGAFRAEISRWHPPNLTLLCVCRT